MPIGDLLASITGEKPSAAPAITPRPTIAIPKRKAEDDLGRTPAKTPRTEFVAQDPSRQNGSSQSLSRPTAKSTGSTDKSASVQRPAAKPQTSALAKAVSAPARASGNSSSTTARQPLPSRPIVKRPTNDDSEPKPEPKKRSFQEVMKRARENAAARESFGKIQHKTLERGLSMRERKEMKAGTTRKEGPPSRQGTPARQLLAKNGAAAPLRRDGANITSQRNGAVPRTARAVSTPSASRKTPPATEEKKVKKAALATTGYTGTARGAVRPRPGASSLLASSKTTAASRDAKPPRYGGALSGSRRNDEYDDELDDFIEYDDEEDIPARGGYDSLDEDESDMEAGLGDIDEEERRAEYFARREDQEQEALERRLKQEKERKRLAASRNGGR